jgi:uncharacterized membrane protein
MRTDTAFKRASKEEEEEKEEEVMRLSVNQGLNDNLLSVSCDRTHREETEEGSQADKRTVRKASKVVLLQHPTWDI